jgi:hypothetical protein
MPAAAAACSRDASAGSCRAGPRPATVAPPADTPPDAGGAGMPPSVTGPPPTASNAAATKLDVIATVGASGRRAPRPPPHPPTPRRGPRRPDRARRRRPIRPPSPARASAQEESRKNPRACPAIARAAMPPSSPRRGPPIGGSARPPAVGLYAASASARPGSVAGDVGASRRDDAPIAVRLDTTRSCRHVLSRPGHEPIVPLPPKTEEGRAGRASRAPVPSLGIAGRIGGPHGTIAPR